MPLQDANDRPRLLITAGPTQEPIDAVRFIGNRSSGRVGVDLADEADARGWDVTLLLGPVALRPTRPGVRVLDFRSTADLESRLDETFASCDVLIMAAAVSDYRPVIEEGALQGKLRRETTPLRLTLESTPDLLAGCARRRKPEQCLVGFALEPRERLLASAEAKLRRKGIDAIVANPLETMDAASIEAWLLMRGEQESERDDIMTESTGGPIDKRAFAGWLLERLAAHRAEAGTAEGCRRADG